ncbi:hypothetical protein QTP88_004278 [Uroleucon formosanum]
MADITPPGNLVVWLCGLRSQCYGGGDVTTHNESMAVQKTWERWGKKGALPPPIERSIHPGCGGGASATRTNNYYNDDWRDCEPVFDRGNRGPGQRHGCYKRPALATSPTSCRPIDVFVRHSCLPPSLSNY